MSRSIIMLYKFFLYVRQKALIPVFRIQNNPFVFTSHTHSSQILFCSQKLILNTGFKDFSYKYKNQTRIWYGIYNSDPFRAKNNHSSKQIKALNRY